MLPRSLTGKSFTSASEFNRQITLMKTESGTDTDGNLLAPTVVASNVYAKIRSVPGGRLDSTQQLSEQVAHFIVTIRYRADVTFDMTILGPSGQTWAITGIDDPHQAHVELRITVREVNGGL